MTSIEKLEALSMVRAAHRAAIDAVESLALAQKCLEDGENAYSTFAGRARSVATDLVDDLTHELLSLETACSKRRWR